MKQIMSRVAALLKTDDKNHSNDLRVYAARSRRINSY